MAAWHRTNCKASGTMLFGQIRPKGRGLAIKHKHRISSQKPHSNCQAWWWRSSDSCLAVIELIMKQLCTKALQSQAWLKLSHETGQ